MDFWNELVKVVVSNGVFAILFVFLFFYQLKDSQKREKNYQNTISVLTTHLGVIEEVRSQVSELKEIIKGEKK
jgi:preprotein translocase subunit YajC